MLWSARAQFCCEHSRAEQVRAAIPFEDFSLTRKATEAKGVDQLLIIGLHDAYVMSGWQKVNSAASPSDNAFVLFMSDLGTRLAHKIGWTAPGDRSGRWVSIIDHGKIRYAKCEPNLWDVTVSSIEAVLEHL